MLTPLKLELNSNKVTDEQSESLKKLGIMITPCIDKDYWVVRVNIFEDQYIQAFPKFATMGIGFSIEEDWNTNLPFSCEAEKICSHIWHNRRYIAIKKKRCIKAIEMIQAYLKEQTE
jgi:hypothetical protein